MRAAATRGSSCSQRVGCRADADDHGTHVAKNRSKNQSLKGGACAHSFRLPGPRPGPDPRVAAALLSENAMERKIEGDDSIHNSAPRVPKRPEKVPGSLLAGRSVFQSPPRFGLQNRHQAADVQVTI